MSKNKKPQYKIEVYGAGYHVEPILVNNLAKAMKIANDIANREGHGHGFAHVYLTDLNTGKHITGWFVDEHRYEI